MVQTATLSSQALVFRHAAVMKAGEPSGLIEDPFTNLELYNPPVGTANSHLVLYINSLYADQPHIDVETIDVSAASKLQEDIKVSEAVNASPAVAATDARTTTDLGSDDFPVKGVAHEELYDEIMSENVKNVFLFWRQYDETKQLKELLQSHSIYDPGFAPCPFHPRHRCWSYECCFQRLDNFASYHDHTYTWVEMSSWIRIITDGPVAVLVMIAQMRLSSSDEPNASRSSDDPLLLGARPSGRSTAGSRYTSRSRSSQREQSPALSTEPDELLADEEDEDEIDKTATDEVMRAYTSNPRTQEWSEQHSNQSQPEPSSTEVRLLYTPDYPEVDGGQGVPYAEFVHVKHTVNGLANTMSALERKLDQLVNTLESHGRSNDSVSSRSGGGPQQAPPPPFPHFPERRTVKRGLRFTAQRRVRCYLKELIPKPDQTTPAVSEQERKEYADKVASGRCSEEAVTLENYRIDLGSTSNSPWNQSAGRVLVPYFVEKSGLSLDDHPGLHTMIIRAFSSHIDSIRDNHRYSRRATKDIRAPDIDRISNGYSEYLLYLHKNEAVCMGSCVTANASGRRAHGNGVQAAHYGRQARVRQMGGRRARGKTGGGRGERHGLGRRETGTSGRLGSSTTQARAAWCRKVQRATGGGSWAPRVVRGRVRGVRVCRAAWRGRAAGSSQGARGFLEASTAGRGQRAHDMSRASSATRGVNGYGAAQHGRKRHRHVHSGGKPGAGQGMCMASGSERCGCLPRVCARCPPQAWALCPPRAWVPVSRARYSPRDASIAAGVRALSASAVRAPARALPSAVRMLSPPCACLHHPSAERACPPCARARLHCPFASTARVGTGVERARVGMSTVSAVCARAVRPPHGHPHAAHRATRDASLAAGVPMLVPASVHGRRPTCAVRPPRGRPVRLARCLPRDASLATGVRCPYWCQPACTGAVPGVLTSCTGICIWVLRQACTSILVHRRMSAMPAGGGALATGWVCASVCMRVRVCAGGARMWVPIAGADALRACGSNGGGSGVKRRRERRKKAAGTALEVDVRLRGRLEWHRGW
ncbi:hypothetical protein GGX14DRAFT_664823 [Mycena pura]|uniref:Uncharacterized protein n=1 Tax=Mycena pura TaxID=153505 RepID=A0AAD6UZT8_9AGAR|nr:hypothetical protein GGX14DRAFT_664823 [Mycena pura]